MARRRDDDDWLGRLLFALIVGGGTLALVYSQSGRREDNSTLLPDEIEKHIDDAVAALDEEFGKRWVNEGLDVVAAFLRGVLPRQMVLLADAFYRAESEFRYEPKAGYAKKRRVFGEADRLGLVRRA